MHTSLKNNQNLKLSKSPFKPLRTVVVGIGWGAYIISEKKSRGFFGFGRPKVGKIEKLTIDADLNASCLLLDGKGRLVDNIYFAKRTSSCGNVIHMADNNGSSCDNEQIRVNLEGLDSCIKHAVFTLNAYTMDVNFNRINNVFCQVISDEGARDIVHTELCTSGTHSSVIMAKISRVDNNWEFKSLLQPCHGRTSSQILPTIQILLDT